MDKSFERKFSINVVRFKLGQHTDSFEVDDAFFEHFDQSLLKEGRVAIDLDIVKYETHLDVTFNFDGIIKIPCDRCSELYPYQLQTSHRIIYAFDKDMNFDGDDVMYVDSTEPQLVLTQEFYDFINISVPLRSVPEKDVHLCNPETLAVLGLDKSGNPMPEDEQELEIDPRWEKLKKLKDQLDSNQSYS